ncbi:MAG: polyphosphate polymerase domain-containing protein [Clostridia bacterium]|nr:polyphosphate polymerase domain-containing protein [Clostridia bacterium]
MAHQTVFKRYELKYMLTLAQKERILHAMEPYMLPDRYGRSTVRNLYLDTDSYRLIRRSIEKPAYKEKLRIRSYSLAAPESTVFVELKKKYKGVVYKRRLSLPEQTAMAWVRGEIPCPKQTQIAREIDYALQYYGELRPTVFLSYDREAYYSRSDGNFRVTFDERILCRRDGFSLREEPSGTPILENGRVLMELKCAGGIPLWMVHALTEEGLYKTSFSKYGTAYQTLIFPTLSDFHYKNIQKEQDYVC